MIPSAPTDLPGFASENQDSSQQRLTLTRPPGKQINLWMCNLEKHLVSGVCQAGRSSGRGIKCEVVCDSQGHAQTLPPTHAPLVGHILHPQSGEEILVELVDAGKRSLLVFASFFCALSRRQWPDAS